MMQTGTLNERAAYVADMAEQLATLLPERPTIAVALGLIALEAAMIVIRSGGKELDEG